MVMSLVRDLSAKVSEVSNMDLSRDDSNQLQIRARFDENDEENSGLFTVMENGELALHWRHQIYKRAKEVLAFIEMEMEMTDKDKENGPEYDECYGKVYYAENDDEDFAYYTDNGEEIVFDNEEEEIIFDAIESAPPFLTLSTSLFDTSWSFTGSHSVNVDQDNAFKTVTDGSATQCDQRDQQDQSSSRGTAVQQVQHDGDATLFLPTIPSGMPSHQQREQQEQQEPQPPSVPPPQQPPPTLAVESDGGDKSAGGGCDLGGSGGGHDFCLVSVHAIALPSTMDPPATLPPKEPPPAEPPPL
jgi:hypothetical protein